MIFVDESPASLLKFFEDHTSFQADKLITPYLGKWMKLSNVVISDVRDEPFIMGRSEDGCSVLMEFQKKWAEQVLVLRRGSNIDIIGKIRRVQYCVVLEDCEILKTQPPQTVPASPDAVASPDSSSPSNMV